VENHNSEKKRGRLTTLRDSSEAEKRPMRKKRVIRREQRNATGTAHCNADYALQRELRMGGGVPQLQNKRGRLTPLRVSSEAEKREPQPQNKRGMI